MFAQLPAFLSPAQESPMLKLLAALLAAGKLGKLLTTGGTMLLSIVAYAFIFGWWYAVGFVGAWIELKDMPHDVETEA